MTILELIRPDGEGVAVPGPALERLRSRLAGPCLAQGDDGYDEARQIWNAMIDRRPALIARCRDGADVARCVRFAREHGVALTVRGGGHNIGGRAVTDGALMIDQSERRAVRVVLEEGGGTGIAEVEPGATLGDLDAATQAHGVVVPTGIVSETGVAGLTLGGGFGWLSRRWGLTCDHLLAAELVTADGERLTVTDDTHPDLLWGLRGGGGGVGIVTSFRFRLRPLAAEVTAGMMIHPAMDRAFDRFRERTADGPEELTCLLKLGAAPPAPFVPEELQGKPVAATIVCHSGEPQQAASDLASLRAGDPAAADVVMLRPFAQFQSMFDAGEPRGRRNYWKSEYVGELDDTSVEILLSAADRFPAPAANIKVFQLGGAVSRMAADATAAGHRDARYIVVIATAWEDPAADDANVAWVRDAWQRLNRHSGRGGYINFLTADASADELGASHGGVDLERLARIRRRHDPHGMFSPSSSELQVAAR